MTGQTSIAGGLNSIADELQKLIDSHVSKSTAPPEDVAIFKMNYEDALCTLNSEISDSREALKDIKEENLKINSVEQEGFLRGLIYAREVLKDFLGDKDDD